MFPGTIIPIRRAVRYNFAVWGKARKLEPSLVRASVIDVRPGAQAWRAKSPYS